MCWFCDLESVQHFLSMLSPRLFNSHQDLRFEWYQSPPPHFDTKEADKGVFHLLANFSNIWTLDLLGHFVFAFWMNTIIRRMFRRGLITGDKSLKIMCPASEESIYPMSRNWSDSHYGFWLIFQRQFNKIFFPTAWTSMKSRILRWRHGRHRCLWIECPWSVRMGHSVDVDH